MHPSRNKFVCGPRKKRINKKMELFLFCFSGWFGYEKNSKIWETIKYKGYAVLTVGESGYPSTGEALN